MQGDGHGAYGGNSRCIDGAVEAYLESGLGARATMAFVARPTAETAVAGASFAVRELLLVATATFVAGAACGGLSERRADGDDAPASGGSTATGGSGSARSCEYAGTVYANGQSFPAGDHCNGCVCRNGSVSCTAVSCPPEDLCGDLALEYDAMLATARDCSPPAAGSGHCVPGALSSLPCGCPTTVDSRFDVRELDTIVAAYRAHGCGEDIECEACPDVEPTGYCSAEGVCVDARAAP